MSERSELTGHAVSEHVGPPGLPVGLGVELDASTRQIGADLLVGGQPRRVLRLGPAGVRAWAQLRNGRVDSAAAGRLARRLTDVGLIHPRPGRQPCPPGVSVIVPVLDRAAALDRCLAALGREHPVVVVDDGSRDAGAIAAVTARHGARLVRRERTGGPAAARNDGLAAVDTGLIA